MNKAYSSMTLRAPPEGTVAFPAGKGALVVGATVAAAIWWLCHSRSRRKWSARRVKEAGKVVSIKDIQLRPPFALELSGSSIVGLVWDERWDPEQRVVHFTGRDAADQTRVVHACRLPPRAVYLLPATPANLAVLETALAHLITATGCRAMVAGYAFRPAPRYVSSARWRCPFPHLHEDHA